MYVSLFSFIYKWAFTVALENSVWFSLETVLQRNTFLLYDTNILLESPWFQYAVLKYFILAFYIIFHFTYCIESYTTEVNRNVFAPPCP